MGMEDIPPVMQTMFLRPHSAVERNIGPDSTIALDFALSRLNNVVQNLNIYPKNMLKNLKITKGIFFSQRVLLELTSCGFSREEAYKIVQKNAMKSWSANTSFYESIINDKTITKKWVMEREFTIPKSTGKAQPSYTLPREMQTLGPSVSYRNQ